MTPSDSKPTPIHLRSGPSPADLTLVAWDSKRLLQGDPGLPRARRRRSIKLEPYVQTILSQPKNEIIVNFPVKMDSGEVRLFKGYRVQHNNLLGPFKGGMRFHPGVTLDDVKALAAMMTWKCVAHAPALRRRQGRHQVRPARASADELQRITRRFTHALGENIGPEYDIPAPDVGTNARPWRG